ncbi:MAG: hypothetical protein ABJL67_23080 [Sulfitobacter sp.]
MTTDTDVPVKAPITIQLGCHPEVDVTLTETPSGTIFVVIGPSDPTMPIGDIDGVFFNLAQDSILDDLVFFPDANQGSIFSPVTGIQANANSVNTLANGAQVKDDYDVGIQFGTVDNSTEGTVQQANFTLSSSTGKLTLEDLDLDSFATVIDSDGGNGMVLTTGDSPDDDPVLVDKVALFEDFDDIRDPAESGAIVKDGGWEVRDGALFTNASNEGELRLASVESDGAASIMFDAMVTDLTKFEASGKYADELRLEVRLNDGSWQTLDTFVVNGDKSALVGSQTGSEITESQSTLNYEGGILDNVDGTVEFRFVSDVTANDEQIQIDNIKVTTSQEVPGVDPTPVAVQSEAFGEDFDGLSALEDSENVISSDGWNAENSSAVTDGKNDGTLTFASSETDGPASISFDAAAEDLSKFDASGKYADSLELQVQVDGGGWETLDTFVVNDDKSALVGSNTGNEITEESNTLTYDGGLLDEGSENVQFRFVSDITASNERISIDNVSVETTALESHEGGQGEPLKVDFDTLSAEDVVSDQFEGVTISAQRNGDDESSENDAMIFDSTNPTGGDDDLAFEGQGNILIISEDNDSDDPDDNAGGGVITFDFDDPSEVLSITMLDIEEAGGTVDLLDENGDLIRTIDIPTTGDGGTQDLSIGTEGVATMNINFVGSGAVDDLCYVQPGDEEDCDAQYGVQYVAGIPVLPPSPEEDDVPMPEEELDPALHDVM